MSQDEVTSLTYSSPLRVNVCVSSYFVQLQVQLALERVHRVGMCNVFRQIVTCSHLSVKKEVCYLLFTHERAEMDRLRPVIFVIFLVCYCYFSSYQFTYSRRCTIL